jgi:hypothetical protein
MRLVQTKKCTSQSLERERMVSEGVTSRTIWMLKGGMVAINTSYAEDI